jgi:hypothetical protein
MGSCVGVDPDDKRVLLYNDRHGDVKFLYCGRDVVPASARKALRGGPVTGHDSRQRVGQASNQATKAGPGQPGKDSQAIQSSHVFNVAR